MRFLILVLVWAFHAPLNVHANEQIEFDPTSETPLSTISIPISKTFSHEFSMIELIAPREEWSTGSQDGKPWNGHNDDGWVFSGDNKSKARYHWWREPLDTRFDGDQLILTTRIHYAAEAQAKIPPFGPWVGGSCDNRNVNLTFQSTIRVLPDWRLQSRTILTQLDAADRCQVTFLNIDVTEKILAKVRPLLDNVAGRMDDRVGQISFQAPVNSGWQALQRTLTLGNGAWLKLNPSSVFMGPLAGRGKTLHVSLGIQARPQLFFTAEPDSSPIPLPPLSAAPSAGGFHLMTDTFIAYDLLTAIFQFQTQGLIFQGPSADQRVEVQAAQITGTPEGKMVVHVPLSGTANGMLTFVGSPQVGAQSTITTPDLSLDLPSQQWLSTQTPWIAPSAITASIRQAATWQIADFVTEFKNYLTHLLNQEIAPGYLLSGQITQLELIQVEAQPKAAMLRLQIDGNVGVNERNLVFEP